MRAWDARAGQCLRMFKNTKGAVACLLALPKMDLVRSILVVIGVQYVQYIRYTLRTSISNSYRCVNAGSEDCTVRVWDALAGLCLRMFKNMKGPVTCLLALPMMNLGTVLSNAIYTAYTNN